MTIDVITLIISVTTSRIIESRQSIDEILSRLNQKMVYAELQPLHVMFTAMHPKDGTRHLGDLLDLKPRQAEVKADLSWLLRRKCSTQFKAALCQVLERIGYERIAEQI